jgi:hypothetical protein
VAGERMVEYELVELDQCRAKGVLADVPVRSPGDLGPTSPCLWSADVTMSKYRHQTSLSTASAATGRQLRQNTGIALVISQRQSPA